MPFTLWATIDLVIFHHLIPLIIIKCWNISLDVTEGCYFMTWQSWMPPSMLVALSNWEGLLSGTNLNELGYLLICMIWRSSLRHTIDLLSYSIASGIDNCQVLEYQSSESHDQSDESNGCYILYDCDDWYFITWQSSMPLEFHWQLSIWVGLLRLTLRLKLRHQPHE